MKHILNIMIRIMYTIANATTKPYAEKERDCGPREMVVLINTGVLFFVCFCWFV